MSETMESMDKKEVASYLETMLRLTEFLTPDMLQSINDGSANLLDVLDELFNRWLTSVFKKTLAWVERAELNRGTLELTVTHSYPVGIRIGRQVREIIRQSYHGKEVIEIVLKRVEPRKVL